MKTYDWTILGAGPCGSALAIALKKANVPSDSIAIVDKNKRPLEDWRRVTKNAGMKFLRTPIEHSISDLPETHHSKDKFLKSQNTRAVVQNGNFYLPSIRFFNHQTSYLLKKYQLHKNLVHGNATAFKKLPNGNYQV